MFEGSVAPTVGGNVFTGVSATLITFPYPSTGYSSPFAGLPGSNSTVTIGNSTGGSTDYTVAGHLYGSSFSINAIAQLGYVFSVWSGDSSSTENPLTFTISGDVNLTPVFGPDLSDLDGDGLSAYSEVFTYGTSDATKDSNSDGIEDGDAVLAGLDPSTDYSAVINYVKSVPSDFDLYDSTSIQDLRLGGLMLEKNGDDFSFTYTIQESVDLSSGWSTHSSPIVTIDPASESKYFLRITLAE